MKLIPKSQQLFYLSIAAAILVFGMVIITAQKTNKPSFTQSKAAGQQENAMNQYGVPMSTSDDLDSINYDLQNTDVNNVDTELENIEDQLNLSE